MNVCEACKYTTLSERTIRELIADGTIKSIRKGRRVILRANDLDEYLEGSGSHV